MHESTKKTLSQEQAKSVHGEDKSHDDLKTKFLSDNDDTQIQEYFEPYVKSEVDSDIEPQRSKGCKHEIQSDHNA